MTNVFTLDDLNSAIESKYAPFIFQAGDETFTLRQVLRLNQSERATVTAELKNLDGVDPENMDEELVLKTIQKVLCVATSNNQGDRLVEILGPDLLKLQLLLEKWMEVTSPGEASPSPV
jgi:hypothetical protein